MGGGGFCHLRKEKDRLLLRVAVFHINWAELGGGIFFFFLFSKSKSVKINNFFFSFFLLGVGSAV